ncbi:MAG: hypothetical protein ABFD76_05075 [Smithella sp.]
MPLKKAEGNMYPWVTHTHSHLGGECPHKCVYCYVDHFPYGRPAKYQGELRLIEKEFSVQYGSGNTIFIENCNDLMAEAVPQLFINKIIMHCLRWPDNDFVFQTKNPARYLTMDALFPDRSLFGCTIETNKFFIDNYAPAISFAPAPVFRKEAMIKLDAQKFITIEPVLDFDVDVLASWMDQIRPEFVNIGADSKGNHLPEPSPEKVMALITELIAAGIDVRLKDNLVRLLPNDHSFIFNQSKEWWMRHHEKRP